MATNIQWTDASGPATLNNDKPTPADRFDNWVPIYRDEASVVHGLGTGTRHFWVFRVDRGATFQLSKIPNTSTQLILRLLRHLARGNAVTVNTGDALSNSYTCVAWPGWDIPEGPEFTDNRMLEYTLSLKLKTTGSANMLCLYGAGVSVES